MSLVNNTRLLKPPGKYTLYRSADKDRHSQTEGRPDKSSNMSRAKSVDFSRYVSSTWKGLSGINSTKSSKSVTFTSQDGNNAEKTPGTINQEFLKSGMMIEQGEEDVIGEKNPRARSISAKFLPPWPPTSPRGPPRTGSGGSVDDLDLWLAFLTETGLIRNSDGNVEISSEETAARHDNTRIDDPDFIIRQMEYYHRIQQPQYYSTNIRDDYDDVHRKYPGLFWDTVTMDDPDKAFLKVKKIIKNIVKMQDTLKPMFDVDFANLPYYPNVEKRLTEIQETIAPHRLFY